MQGTDFVAVASAGAALASAIAAGGAWRAAWRAGRATEALTEIEAARRWQELMPQFTPSLSLVNSGGSALHLDMELVEPVALQRLESVTVRIRDDRPGRDRLGLAGPQDETAVEQIRAQVWGPFRFTPHVGPDVSHRADANGRAVDIMAPWHVGEALRFQLEPTRPPAWMHADGVDTPELEGDWLRMVGSNIRLTVTARARGLRPWVIPMEIEAGKPKVAFSSV